jgi:tetratricopeptide (TPR) repeat protein
VWVEKGKYSEAERLYTQVIAIREQVLGPANPLLAEVWNDLGFLCLQQRRYKDAETWLDKAANAWRAAAGTEAYAAVAQNNLAMLRRLEGNLKQSEALYKHALETEETKFGPEHPEVATTLVNLAALYRIRGEDEAAENADRRALALLEKSLGENDPMALEIRARLKQAGGDFQLLLVRTKEQADELRNKLVAGEQFTQLASRYSIDPSAASGGFVKARLSEIRAELRDNLQPLKLGGISAVFPLDRNWAIVKRTK